LKLNKTIKNHKFLEDREFPKSIFPMLSDNRATLKFRQKKQEKQKKINLTILKENNSSKIKIKSPKLKKKNSIK